MQTHENHGARVREFFGGELDWVQENDLYSVYAHAVEKVSLYYGLGITPERLHTVVASMGEFKLRAEEVKKATKRLIRSSDVNEELRFRKLNAGHFFRAARQAHTSGSGRRGRAV